MNYKQYYENQAGSGYPVFRGYSNQKGYGLGGIFKTFYRFIMPLFKTHALPVLKKGAEAVGKEAVKTAANIANDAISGQNFKESAKHHMQDAINTLSSKAQETIQEGTGKYKKTGKKRKISNLKKSIKKIRRLKDIFDKNEFFT